MSEGAGRGRPGLLARAMEVDPTIPDKKAALQALAEMIEAHADVLPQFS